MSRLQNAEQIARYAHQGQCRRDGSPYITHPERVAASLSDPLFKEVAWLHDVLEDTRCTADDLRKAGVNEAVIEGVEMLTKREGEQYEDFIQRVKAWGGCAMIKIADIMDNLSDAPTEKQVKKYAAALKVLTPA